MSNIDNDLKKDVDQFFDELFPDYKEGEYYDFSHGEISAADARRYREVGELMEKALADNAENIEISNKEYGFF